MGLPLVRGNTMCRGEVGLGGLDSAPGVLQGLGELHPHAAVGIIAEVKRLAAVAAIEGEGVEGARFSAGRPDPMILDRERIPPGPPPAPRG